MNDYTEQDEDSVIGMPFQYEGSGITCPADLKKPQLEFKIGDIHVVVLRGDITKEKSEGIVSAASSLLDSCFGIAKAIATAADIGGGQIDLCVRSFIDGLLIFINRLEKGPRLQEIHLINTDLEGTQLTIVMLQQLLEMGLKNLRREALTNFGKKYAKKTTTTKPKRSSCLPRFNTRERILSCTIDNDTEAETLLSTWGRTSTVSRKTNTSKLKETHSGQVTLSTSTQMNRPAYETGVISRRSERDQDGSSFPTRTDRDSLSASAGRPFSAGSSLNSQKSTGSSSTTRPAPSTGVTSGKSERDQDGNGSSFPTRTGRDGQSASAGRPFSAGPRLKSKKSTGSSKSKTDSLDGGSVGHTKNPPQIKPSLFSQEQEHCLIMLQHHEGISSIVQTSVPKQDTVPVECQDENLLCSFGVGSIHVTVLCGDILRERSCGIVNAANGSLMHAAGVAGIIARAAGPEMELECENFISMRGSLRTTEVMHTSAGGQFSREVTHILHAVGPIWIGETFKDKFYYELTKTFMNCLIYANDKLGLESLTLPLISSGIFGAPLDECVRCFLDGLLVYSKQETKTRHLKKVHLIFKDPDSTMLCIAILQQLLDNGIENLTKEALEMYSEHEIRNSEKARLLDSKDWTRYKYT